jgi:replicative DNA helicase
MKKRHSAEQIVALLRRADVALGSVEQRNPPIPILSDLRESGSIEQDADSVLMFYRRGAYDEDYDQPNLTDVYIRKNRHGPTGRAELMFEPAKMSFIGVDRHSPIAR